MLRKLLLGIMIVMFSALSFANAQAAEDYNYTKLTVVDLGTFNEYRYRITEQFFELRSKFDINGSIHTPTASKILDLAKEGYNYLPDSLVNNNLYDKLKTSILKGIKYPDNESNYSAIVIDIQKYLENVDIQKIQGKVDATPEEGNAPLTVTLRGQVTDPSGSKIEAHNYIWWIDQGGKRKIIGKKQSINYTFIEEGNFSVFLDVISSHKNSRGFTDVLPFRSRADIKIKEKVASVIIKVNGDHLRQNDILKFTPEEARAGLLFDATSSTPTSGTKFSKTKWEFGNGVIREYTGDPKVERIVYAKEGEFTVKLTLRTNENKTTERKFVIAVHDPIATVQTSKEEGFLGEKFTFSAKPSGNDKNLSYSWEIIDIERDEVILRKNGSLFTYTFQKKGKYNVKLLVTEPSGTTDIDTKIIYINSRAPKADFTSSIPANNKPNTVLLDASKTYDPDFSDEGKLNFSWVIDGSRVELDDPNYNGSVGYYTFDSIGEHSVVLEVTDTENIPANISKKVEVKSILSVDFFAFPRVAARNTNIRFVSQSPEARFYEWDFGDGKKEGGKDAKINHVFEKSGIFNVKLTVRDSDDNKNTFTKNVYIGESDSPYAFIEVAAGKNSEAAYVSNACDGQGAYIVNRVDTVKLNGNESIDITGETTGLTYSWKIGRDKYFSNANVAQKFDELGCVPVKLTVKSNKNGRTSSISKWLKVENVKPTLSSLNVSVTDINTDPVVVKVTAQGSKDADGVIQSYLWYYYTDVDSEPQDFRATKSSSTSFVLPKITGNYYFVVVMKDNNEARVTSEEVTGSKYFITLTGNNTNTPLVSLTVNDSSFSIGDEVTFTAKVENILGTDISKKVEYSWDLDGDGFYEQKTSTSIFTYKYEISGEIHPKVKVKHKGFSNTKSLTVNVSNILKPDFSYISIGNKVIFLDTSIGKYSNIEWDLADKNIVKGEKTFVHEYGDDNAVHFVELKISEGTKVKTTKKKVVKNVKNLLTARKGGLVLFSHPDISGEDEIILDEKGEKVFIYIGESTGEIAGYVVDYDLDNDSDLNGGKDDDEDNKLDSSYVSGSAIEIKLNKQKHQKVRVYLKDTEGGIIESKDVLIVKEYIEEDLIDIDSLTFDNVSESEKLKLEKLKDLVKELPKGDKLKALMYVQQLQEEWFDKTEKTKIIYEFQAYLSEIGASSFDEMAILLELLLREGDEVVSEKETIFIALENLLPIHLVCVEGEKIIEGEVSECYTSMVSKLETIRDNSDVEENKALGDEVWAVVSKHTEISNADKKMFGQILKNFVYNGGANVPEEELDTEDEEVKKDSQSSFLSLLSDVLFGLLIIVGVFVGAIAIFWLYYKLTNKDDNLGFQDFIIEKTSGVKPLKPEVVEDDTLDILSELSADVGEKKKSKNEDAVVKGDQNNTQDLKKDESGNLKKDDTPEIKVEKGDVPDWLSGATKDMTPTETLTETPTETPKETPKDTEEEKGDVPDWLKGSFTEKDTPVQKSETEKTQKSDTQKSEFSQKDTLSDGLISDEDIEEATKLESDDKVPDWLKGSFGEDKKEGEKKSSEKKPDLSKTLEEKTEEKKENIGNSVGKNEGEPVKKSPSNNSDDNIPDWLKGSFGDDKKEGEKKVPETKSDTSKNMETKLETKQENNLPKIEEKKQANKNNSADQGQREKDKNRFVKHTEKENSKPVQTNKNSGNKGKGGEEKKKEATPKKSPTHTQKSSVKTEEKKVSTPIKQPVKKESEKVPNDKEVVSPKKTSVPPVKVSEKSEKTSEKEVKTPLKQEKKPIPNKVDANKEEKEGKQSKTDAIEKVIADDSKKNNAELWDDGMKIPDWLKTDDDK